jgi:hypothetical protein
MAPVTEDEEGASLPITRLCFRSLWASVGVGLCGISAAHRVPGRPSARNCSAHRGLPHLAAGLRLDNCIQLIADRIWSPLGAVAAS